MMVVIGRRAVVDDELGAQRLNSGGVKVDTRDRYDQVGALVGNELALLKLLAVDRPELLDTLVDAALERKLSRLTQELQNDPDRFFREHVAPYQPPLFDPNQTTDKPNGRRGRRKGDTNVSREYFWEQYRGAADQLTRPYRWTHLQARTCFTYWAFRKYFELWGAPPGYAKPGE